MRRRFSSPTWCAAAQTPQRSAVDFTGHDLFRAAERYYVQSEQRMGRFFAFGPEDFVFVSAQPQCDLVWLEELTVEDIQTLDEAEQLSLLEKRYYRWECGCTQERMMAVLASVMKSDPEGLFGNDPVVRISCPRCGARHKITREALEAYVGAEEGGIAWTILRSALAAWRACTGAPGWNACARRTCASWGWAVSARGPSRRSRAPASER